MFLNSTMHGSGHRVVETLVVALVIVEVEVGRQAAGQCWERRVVTDVDVFVLDRTPQAFDEDIVEGGGPGHPC